MRFMFWFEDRGSHDEAGLDHMPVVESSKQCSKSHQRERERERVRSHLSVVLKFTFFPYSITISLRSSDALLS